MEYAIVEAASAAELAQLVNDKLSAGWVPAGGLAVYRNDFGGAAFYQAVVLLPDDDEEPDDE